SKITPDHRIVIIEDTAELQCASENKVILRATDKVDMLRLLKATMRLRPDRIIVGETRGKEALDLLKAWNTGHPGGIATIHANSANGGLTRMEQLISEATNAKMSKLIAEAVNLIVFISKSKEGRKVKEIIKVIGYENDKYITQAI
ncbi:ATPase, T2SS/T4P/T4SS family, partial [Campylobacter coli]